MSTDFQREHQTPGNRYRPSPGMVGNKAGLAAGSARGKQEQPKSPGRAAKRAPGGGGGLGFPEQLNQHPEQPQDYRHLVVLGQYENMKDLGNEVPFGVQAINNGEFRRIFKPGMMPFDIFWDT